jgi:hypothetical protein
MRRPVNPDERVNAHSASRFAIEPNRRAIAAARDRRAKPQTDGFYPGSARARALNPRKPRVPAPPVPVFSASDGRSDERAVPAGAPRSPQ